MNAVAANGCSSVHNMSCMLGIKRPVNVFGLPTAGAIRSGGDPCCNCEVMGNGNFLRSDAASCSCLNSSRPSFMVNFAARLG